MIRRKGWHIREEEFLIENYATMTIKELQKRLEDLSNGKRKRSADSINAKIKRLKAEGRIEGQKEEETVVRSLIQRRKKI
jgi:DNA-binding PadR family transcriptional regulator